MNATIEKTVKKIELRNGGFFIEHNIKYCGFLYSEGPFGNTLIDPYGYLTHIRGMPPRDWEAAKKYIEAYF